VITSLLIDAGNSRLKWGIYHQGRLKPGAVVNYQDGNLYQQLVEAWQSLVATNQRPDRVVLANVAGANITEALDRWRKDFQNSVAMLKGGTVKDGFQLTIVPIASQADAFGVKNAYRQPEALGADRWAGLVAARHHIKGDVCIIDCGSALTIDVLAANGEHKGGIIMPGWEMMKTSLIMKTDGISEKVREKSQEKTTLLGCDTSEAIEAGSAAGCVGAIEYIVHQYQQETGTELQCILTGGAAPLLLPLLNRQDMLTNLRYEPDWVLKGLVIISDAMISDTMVESVQVNDPGQTK
jgi:type III pantothenate kinase